MKAAELRAKKPAELLTLLGEWRRQHLQLRMQRGLGQVAAPSDFSKARRDIARVQTLLREQELARRGQGS